MVPVETPAVLGVRLADVTMSSLVARALSKESFLRQTTLMYANVHVLNTAYTNARLRAILNGADLVYCDGAGAAVGARLLGHSLAGRITGADWIEPLCEACEARDVTLFFLGSRPGVAVRAAGMLHTRHPDLRVVGTHHGYLADPDVCRAAISAVNAARPGILLVGMGTPTQEKWIAAHRDELEVPVVWAVGALFDFVAGVQSRGPRWMLDNGLEWLYRLASDPRRLWRRYVIGNPLFVARVLWQRFAGRRHTPES